MDALVFLDWYSNNVSNLNRNVFDSSMKLTSCPLSDVIHEVALVILNHWVLLDVTIAVGEVCGSNAASTLIGANFDISIC